MDAQVGWHGKLPAARDFISGGLEPLFVARWDEWLARGLGALREGPEHWLEAYLASPTWRFLLLPGALAPDHEAAWAGVLMPSVDGVGRYFPLTLACQLPALPSSSLDVPGLWRWLGALQEIALDALEDDWTVPQLQEALLAMSPLRIEDSMRPETLADDRFAWHRQLRGKAFWYAAAQEQPARLLASGGLQDEGLVGALFCGPAA